MLTAARINVGLAAVRFNIDFNTCLCGYQGKRLRERLDKTAWAEEGGVGDTLDPMD